jgi:hypothetical protein
MTLEQIINGKTFWKISLGNQGSLWEACLDENITVMGNYGLAGLGDLNRYSSPADIQKAGVTVKGSHQLWDYFDGIKVGDYVVSYASNQILGIGVVTEDVYYSEDNDDLFFLGENYIREVEWLAFKYPVSIHKDPVLWIKPGKGPFARNSTLVRLKDEEAERLIEVLRENKVDIESILNAR